MSTNTRIVCTLILNINDIHISDLSGVQQQQVPRFKNTQDRIS